MTDRLTDADIIERLKVVKQSKTQADAASRLGIEVRAVRETIAAAKSRGLTAETKIVDEAGALRAKLKSAEAEIRAIKRTNDTAASLREEIYGLAAATPEPPKWTIKAARHASDTTYSVPVALWSDWHWGEVVNPDEIGGLNSFNRSIAKERLQRLLSRTVNLTQNHMGKLTIPGIVVCLGGDMISGNIHEELRETNEGDVQQSLIELQDQLASALTVMADTYGKVFVPCVVGNHGRMTHKPRAKGRAYTSFEWNLYQQLERHFRNDKRLRFKIADGPDVPFSVLGHRYLLTHGDSLGVKGGDGIIGAIGPIARGAMKIGRAEAQIGRDFDTLLMGHWHTYIPRGDVCPVIVNSTLKGYDEFAHTLLRVPYSRPGQALWFNHQRHGITAQWKVFVDGVGEPMSQPGRSAWVEFEQAA